MRWRRAAGKGELDAVIDCAGAAEMIRTGFELLSVGFGHVFEDERLMIFAHACG